MIGARLILEDGSYFEGELFGAAQARGGRRAFAQRHRGAPDQGSSGILRVRACHIRILHIGSGKVRTVRLAAADSFKSCNNPLELKGTRRQYCLPHRFILSVVKYDPRKNVPNLLEAFRLCRNLRRLLHAAGEHPQPETEDALVYWQTENRRDVSDFTGWGMYLPSLN
jgi:hypothetical protein